MALPAPGLMTEAEYLAFERASDTRHEYRQGNVVAVVGASRVHARITLNLGAAIDRRLGDGPCEAWVNDLRVRASAAGLYAYPDVAVVCGEAQFADDHVDMLLNPTLIAEVLSPSTEAYDRGKKFRDYSMLPSLREYVLVAQDEPRVEQFLRQESDLWLWQQTAGLDAAVEFPSIGCHLTMREIYRRVRFG